MNKFIRNNQKKLLAVFGIFLMISFVASTGTGRSGGGSEATIGTFDHGKSKLGAREYDSLTSQWRFLKDRIGQPALCAVLMGVDRVDEQYLIRALGDPTISDRMVQMAQMRAQNAQLYSLFYRQQDPLAATLAEAAQMGLGIYRQIEDKEEMFPLLVKDAEMQGVGVNTDLIESILAARGITKDADAGLYDSMRLSLRSLLMINNAAARATSVVKVSRPEMQNSLASRLQEMSVNVVEFNAKDFLDKVPAPTAPQLQVQFDKNKDKLAGGTGLSFGYKYPNRVMYDAVEIRREDMKKGVAPIEPEDATLYYSQHKAAYHASTMPTTSPFNDLSIDRGPTTRQMPYEEAKPKIIQTLTDQRTDELLEKVRDAVRNTMKADYDAYKAAADAKTTTAPSSLGVQYTDSKTYIAKLKEKILADFKVELRTESAEGWRTDEQLRESNQGKDSFATTENQFPFPIYMTGLVDTFLSADDLKRLASNRGDRKPIAVWEPTAAFENAKRDAFLIARVTKAEASHVPASLDEVKEKVTEDVKLAAANELAKKAAQAAVDDAVKTPKWLYTVATELGRKAFTTGLFGSADANMGALPVAGYELKGEAITDFKKGVVKLLAATPRNGEGLKPATRPADIKPTTQPATQSTTQSATQPTTKAVAATTMPTIAPVVTTYKEHPVGLIELPSEAKVVAVEIEQLKPIWTKDQQVQAETLIANQRRSSEESVQRFAWFNYDQLVKRMGYAAVTEKRDNKPVKSVPQDNPFGG